MFDVLFGMDPGGGGPTAVGELWCHWCRDVVYMDGRHFSTQVFNIEFGISVILLIFLNEHDCVFVQHCKSVCYLQYSSC